MPLPPALAARLAKRGIVKDAASSVQSDGDKANEDEEVFAEDYDDMPKENDQPEHYNIPPPEIMEGQETTSDDEESSNEPVLAEVINCPMKVNPYHECSDYCRNTYGLKLFEPELKMLKLRERMLRRFPLPENWKEVADPITNRYYYWNMMTDQVSWLSPAHPRAVVTLPADRLKGLLSDKDNLSDHGGDDEEKMEGSDLSDDDDSLSGSDSEGEVILSDKPDRRRDYGRRDNRGRGGGQGRGRNERRENRKRDELDPMDPASYSEAPRGTWSSGLDQRGSAKTGVDATAAGPLFQQRPYPSPGAVLRANKQMEAPDS